MTRVSAMPIEATIANPTGRYFARFVSAQYASAQISAQAAKPDACPEGNPLPDSPVSSEATGRVRDTTIFNVDSARPAVLGAPSAANDQIIDANRCQMKSATERPRTTTTAGDANSVMTRVNPNKLDLGAGTYPWSKTVSRGAGPRRCHTRVANAANAKSGMISRGASDRMRTDRSRSGTVSFTDCVTVDIRKEPTPQYGNGRLKNS
jgi:hypothetical protein